MNLRLKNSYIASEKNSYITKKIDIHSDEHIKNFYEKIVVW